MMEKHNVFAVSYAIINDYGIIASDVISLNSKLDAAPDSIFQACSLSKCLTAYAVLHLVGKNKINLDYPINKQLKTWKIPKSKYCDKVSPKQITIRSLILCIK